MKIYTRRGDDGTTELANGRVSKSSRTLIVLGELDELSAAIGLANADGKSTIDWIGIQSQLLDLGSAIGGYTVFAKTSSELEALIDQLSAELPELKNFVIPMGDSSRWHLARAICRRCELHYWSSAQPQPLIGQYLNRLSDLLFQQARAASEGDVRYKQSRGLF